MNTNFDDSYIAFIIKKIKPYFDDITYLGAHFSMEQISIQHEQHVDLIFMIIIQ
jgi:hypothetical protein